MFGSIQKEIREGTILSIRDDPSLEQNRLRGQKSYKAKEDWSKAWDQPTYIGDSCQK